MDFVHGVACIHEASNSSDMNWPTRRHSWNIMAMGADSTPDNGLTERKQIRMTISLLRACLLVCRPVVHALFASLLFRYAIQSIVAYHRSQGPTRPHLYCNWDLGFTLPRSRFHTLTLFGRFLLQIPMAAGTHLASRPWRHVLRRCFLYWCWVRYLFSARFRALRL